MTIQCYSDVPHNKEILGVLKSPELTHSEPPKKYPQLSPINGKIMIVLYGDSNCVLYLKLT